MACEAVIKATWSQLGANAKTVDEIWLALGPWWVKETVREALEELVEREACVPFKTRDGVGFKVATARDLKDRDAAARAFLLRHVPTDNH